MQLAAGVSTRGVLRDDASERERIEIDRLGRLRRTAVALPQSLVAAFAETRSHCLAAWEEARSSDDYATFLGPFAQLLKLMRERAEALKISDTLYDGLLDEHEHAGVWRFEVECRVAALPQPCRGSGGTRRGAEQAAAAVALEQLQTDVRS